MLDQVRAFVLAKCSTSLKSLKDSGQDLITTVMTRDQQEHARPKLDVSLLDYRENSITAWMANLLQPG
jgi:hypothetical protein